VTPPYEVVEHTRDVVGTGGAVLAILAKVDGGHNELNRRISVEHVC
jgi:hypothetical protein